MSGSTIRAWATILVAAGLLAGCSSTSERLSGQAVLDFSRPPNQFHAARLVMLNGQNVNAPASRSSFWVDPGVHEIVIAAAINTQTRVTSGPTRRNQGTDPGRTTIEVEAGKRYNIGAQVINESGDWEPVIWRIQDQ